MSNSLSGKVALITAGSAGLGAAIAHKLASAGMRLVINYSSNESRATSLIQELRSTYVSSSSSSTEDSQSYIAIKADVGSRPDITRLVSETVAAMGQLDVVVSNAGWTRFTHFTELDEAMVESDWDRCFNMNVKSHLFLMHAAKPYLEAAEGAFVTTASVAGVKPSGSSVAYAVTKAAQIHLVKTLAMIVGPKIRVNCISPGILLTEWGLQFSEEHLNNAKEKTLLKRFATVEDCAEQVLLFAKSRSITGTNALLDSGFSL